jgi:hypothetical protein
MRLAAVAAMIGALFCFAGAAAEAAALGRPHQLSTLSLVIALAVFAVAAVALVRVSIACEHRWRTTRSSLVPRAASGFPPAFGRRRTKNGPVARMRTILYAVGLLAFLIYLSVDLHAKAARSALTQHHGLPRTGTVQFVHAVNHSNKSGSWTTYNYYLALTTLAAGTNRTVVHDPTRDFQHFTSGESVAALVDPKNPSYAELAGRPLQSSSWFVGPLIIAVWFTGFAGLITHEELKHRRQRATARKGPALLSPHPTR